jgi:shikimate kinase
VAAPATFAGRHLVLMGLRASGKTTAGQFAARALGIAFIDLDALVLRELDSPSVAHAWASTGERAFRDAEARCLRAALSRDRHDVLALGGGTPMIDAARHDLQAAAVAGVVVGPVYLHAPPEELARRLAAAPGDRPPLSDADLPAEVRGVYEKRDSVYQALAGEVVEVGELSPEATAERLAAAWNS